MTIPKLTPYTGQVANPDGSQTQTEFTQNMFDQLSYEAQLATQLDATIDGMNSAVDEVESNAVSAENSANAAEAAAESAGYQGLWPDTGGSADKGDTYQTQVGGTPTGNYFTALQNTTSDPVGDNVNWKVNISASSASEIANAGDSHLAGGKILPVENRGAVDGEDLTGASFVKLIGGNFVTITQFPIAKKTPNSSPISGNLSNINLTNKPYSATIGTEDVWLLDQEWYNAIIADLRMFWADTSSDCSASLNAAVSIYKNIEVHERYLLATPSGSNDNYQSVADIRNVDGLSITGNGEFYFPDDSVRTPISGLFLVDCKNFNIEIGFDGNSQNRVMPIDYAPYDNFITVADGCENGFIKPRMKNAVGFGVLIYSKFLLRKIYNINVEHGTADVANQSPYTVINCIGGGIRWCKAINGNKLAPSVNFGIHLESAENKGFDYAPIDFNVIENEIDGFKTGVFVFNSAKNVHANRNKIKNCDKGMQLREDMRNVEALHNNIDGCLQGIEFGSFTNINNYEQTLQLGYNTILNTGGLGIFATERANGVRIYGGSVEDCATSSIALPVNSERNSITGVKIRNSGLGATGEVAAVILRGTNPTLSGCEFIKDDVTSTQYIVNISSVGSEITGIRSIGDNNRSNGNPYYLEPGNSFIPLVLGDNITGNELLDDNVYGLGTGYINPNGVFTSKAGGALPIVPSDMKDGRNYTFIRDNVTFQYVLTGTFYSPDNTTTYTTITVVDQGSFVVLAKRNGRIYITQEVGTITKV